MRRTLPGMLTLAAALAALFQQLPCAAAEPARASNASLPDEPFSFDKAWGRLPKNVVPLDYSLNIVPDIANHAIHGEESIKLQFRERTGTVQFNSLNQTLDHVLFDGKPVPVVDTVNERQLTTLTLAEPAAPGMHTLTFNYEGKMETRPFGLFVQPFVKPDGSKDQLLSTKFEATDARRMFPCWDEPAFRTTFALTATVPVAWSTVSNMPIAKRVLHDDQATVTFARSPKMPTYLLEFTAGSLAAVTADVGPTKLGVWTVRGQENDGATALANAKQILADYNDYFGVAFPLPKLDSIAVPGGFTGAMENWGAITYNDQILLVTPSSTIGNKQAVFSVQAHEMAHQWNGDLVTMGWWDDLWLNESFASWRAAKETDLRNPSWNWWENEDASKERAMDADARVTSHPIRSHVSNELEARSAFDPQITYSKGQAVLRMLEAYLGEDTFRDGVRRFMKARAFSNATSADLWNALNAASGRDVRKIAASWTDHAGFPLVIASASCDAAGNRTLSLSQKRFLLQNRGGAQNATTADAANAVDMAEWNVPLQMRVGNGKPVAVLLAQDDQRVAAGRCDEALSLNADVIGYYRVAYDQATLHTNVAHFAQLPFGDRIAQLDDQWAQAEADARQLPDYLAFVAAMGSKFDERAWEQITHALSIIEYDERGTPGHEAFAAYARAVLKPVADSLGWDPKADETPGIQRLRRTVLNDLGAWGDQTVVEEARRRFAAFAANHDAIRPDDQGMILSIVARNADAAGFEQLHAVAKTAKNETELRRYYTALMNVRDEGLAKQAAEIALSPEIPEQAAAQRLNMVATLDDEHPLLSWQVLTGHLDALMAAYPQYGPLILSRNVPEQYWNAVPLDELETWVKAHVPEPMLPNVARGMEVARFKLAEKAALVQATDAFIAGKVH
ncbi:MAG: ERAP1-like C-terminal domain-containing protein [Burkholderiaceae bacterium]|nr:ERAP1-like C-terminal domain-containing protein [Burkholderiaceae bacterium]